MVNDSSNFTDREILSRAELLLGEEVMQRLGNIKVIIFGIGGVGSWCAESLVRTGVKNLTIVDSDCVAVSNINRQLMATTRTVGEEKVAAMRNHLLTILPDADIKPVSASFSSENVSDFHLDQYDVVIDAIDSLKDKVALIDTATRLKCKFYSSMGAALKCDPSRIKVAEFRKVTGCPLARALRNRFKKMGYFPRRKFLCVYSDELLENSGLDVLECTDNSADLARKASINGSLMHITAIFGLTLAGLVVDDIRKSKI